MVLSVINAAFIVIVATRGPNDESGRERAVFGELSAKARPCRVFNPYKSRARFSLAEYLGSFEPAASSVTSRISLHRNNACQGDREYSRSLVPMWEVINRDRASVCYLAEGDATLARIFDAVM